MRTVVGVAEMTISANKEDTLVTCPLGSCLGIAVHDPVAGIGGVLHVMLPQSTVDPEKAIRNPFLFVDTGVPKLFLECYKLGARKERLVVKVAGGACSHGNEEEDFFQIGKRNFTVLRQLFWKTGVLPSSYAVGGTGSRSISLEIWTGDVLIKVNGVDTKL